MLILHAAQVKGNLVLWSEDSKPRPRPPGRQAAGKHPYCAQAQVLAEAVGLETGDDSFASAVAWLPTLGDAPVPSSPMAGPTPKSRAKPRIRPWIVTTLQLKPEQAAQLLQTCHQRQVLKPGVAIGTDLAYWTHALTLASALTSRQQFLPSLSERGGQTVAAWIPVFIGEDAQRLAELAKLMPASARALTGTGATEPPATPAQAVLREFITVQVDHLARAGTDTEHGAQPEFDSAHDAWLSALGQANPAVQGNPAQLQQLRRQVAEWQRPLAIAANSPYRLCLRLEEPAEGMKRRGSILDTLTKLKQACNHPRQLLGDNSAITGRSGKLARLQEILGEVLPAGDRVLLFSQFAEMGAILQQHVQETYGLETPFLHGGVTRKQRDLMVQRFQNDPGGPQVFVLSLKAGGSGLNLPRANHVIHYDRWWNPAVENQATDRAFRIGQTKDVHVHKLICAGTLEDRIDLMIEIKQETADQVVGTTSERWLTELSNAELREVLALSATPVD